MDPCLKDTYIPGIYVKNLEINISAVFTKVKLSLECYSYVPGIYSSFLGIHLMDL